MALRRGFKSQAAELAREVRSELGLRELDCLDPRDLARHVEIPVMSLSDLADAADGARYFLTEEPDALSALTVFDGPRRMIVHNDSHSEARQNSNIVHELAHGLLHHEPTFALDGSTGCRNWDDRIEAEANWLTGELLVTRRAALAVARGNLPWHRALQRLRVSAKMLDWRVNVTGARTQVEREWARRRAHQPTA